MEPRQKGEAHGHDIIAAALENYLPWPHNVQAILVHLSPSPLK